MIITLVASLLLAQADTQPRVVVSPLRADGASAAFATAVTEAVVGRLSARTDIETLTDAEIARLMQQEEQRQLAGCSTDACLSDIARIVDANEILTGSVSVAGERYIISLARLDPKDGSVRHRVQRETRSEEELVDASAEAVDALWDTQLPATRCVECVALQRRGMLALKLGNDFSTFFKNGLDVSLFAPGFDLEVAYHVWRRLSLTFSVGVAFGKSEREVADDAQSPAEQDDNVRFQVVPLTFGARYDIAHLSDATLLYGGLAIGVGLVRTALTGEDDLTSAFSAEANLGVAYAFARRWRLLAELGYAITTNTPQAVRSAPLNAAEINIGAGFVF